MEFNDRIKGEFAKACCGGCCKDGCSLDLKGIVPPPSVVDADVQCKILKHGGKTPDYDVFPIRDELVLLVLEIKIGRLDASDAINRIQVRATFWDPVTRQLQAVLPSQPRRTQRASNELKVLAGKRITFRGKNYLAILRRCGARLLEILETFES